jgi:hypothetical protein
LYLKEKLLPVFNAVEFGDSQTFRRNISPPSSERKNKPSKKPASAGFLLGLVFTPEGGSDMVSRNVGLLPNCTALQAGRPDSS